MTPPRVLVYYKENCELCDKAKDILKRCGLEFSEIPAHLLAEDDMMELAMADKGLDTPPLILVYNVAGVCVRHGTART